MNPFRLFNRNKKGAKMYTNIVQHINDNHSAYMVMLTGVYVIATIGLMFSAFFTIENMRKYEEQRIRPRISIDVIRQNGSVYLKVQNSGLTAAYNVKVEFEPKLIGYAFPSGAREPYWTRNGISYLPPGKTLSDVVGGDEQFVENHGKLEFTVLTECSSDSGKVYKDTFRYDLAHLDYAVEL